MTVLQAAAVLVLWRSGLFDTADIATALGGASPRQMSAACCMPCASAKEALTCMW